MLGETHAKLAREVAKELNLKESEAKLLEMGSKRPDSFEAFPHHKGKSRLILEKIIDARGLFLSGDDEAYVKLGEALHYIADGWTTRPRTSDAHTRWEVEINKCNIEKEPQFEKTILKSTIPTGSQEFYQGLSRSFDELYSIKDFKNTKGIPIRYKPDSDFVLDLNLSFGNELLTKYRKLARESKPPKGSWDEKYPSIIDMLTPPIHEEDYLPGGELLSTLSCATHEGYSKFKYSTPAIDLDIAFKICLVISNLVLSKAIILPPPKLAREITWNNIPVNYMSHFESSKEKELIDKAEIKVKEKREEARHRSDKESQHEIVALRNQIAVLSISVIIGVVSMALLTYVYFKTGNPVALLFLPISLVILITAILQLYVRKWRKEFVEIIARGGKK
jgi:hypothetical protein